MVAYPIARRSFLPFVRFFAKRIDGMENIPLDRPVVIAANHLGLFDPLFLGAVYVSRTKRKLRFLVDTSNRFWHSLGYVLQHWTNTIAVHPDHPAEAVDRAVDYLGRGDSVGIFPEGKASGETQLLPGKTGAIRIALGARIEVLPVGIENTDVRLLTILGRRFINQQEGISIRFGRPYRPTGDANDPTAVRQLTDGLMERISSLCRIPYQVTA